MTAPFVRELLATNLGAIGPGFTEEECEASREISLRVLQQLGADQPARQTKPPTARVLAAAVASHLAKELPMEAPGRRWTPFAGDRRRDVSGFQQYRHLPRRAAAMDADGAGALWAEWGTEWPPPPDVAVGLGEDELNIFLHAAITCLWAIEPEDVPAIKHQGTLLNRLRHGRQPHIVVVTAEMLPDRLAALGSGTGEIDGIYHVALQELEVAVRSLGHPGQLSLLHELINNDRVFDVGRLASVIARY